MIGLMPGIALRHLLARRRQSLVSLSGIVLGVAFFLAVSSLMQGSEKDFIRRLVDNSPHITGAIEIRRVKPLTETRGIRQILEGLRTLPALRKPAARHSSSSATMTSAERWEPPRM